MWRITMPIRGSFYDTVWISDYIASIGNSSKRVIAKDLGGNGRGLNDELFHLSDGKKETQEKSSRNATLQPRTNTFEVSDGVVISLI
jgi:hypothetical protein